MRQTGRVQHSSGGVSLFRADQDNHVATDTVRKKRYANTYLNRINITTFKIMIVQILLLDSPSWCSLGCQGRWKKMYTVFLW